MSIEKVLVFIGGGLGVVLVAVGGSILFAYPVMWLWNWLMPAIFGLKAITIQTLMDISLVKLLTKKIDPFHCNALMAFLIARLAILVSPERTIQVVKNAKPH